MNNDYYTSFLDTANKVIDNNNSPAGFCLKDLNIPLVAADKAVRNRFKLALFRSIENLDENLARFEKLFSNKHNAVFWATDYNDVFDNLKKLFKIHKAKSVRLPNINSSTIFRELGIKYFLRDNKIDLLEEGDIQFFVADILFADTGSILLLNQSNSNFSRLNNGKTNVFFTSIDRIVCNTEWAEIYQQLYSYKSGSGAQDMIIFKGSENCNNYLFIIDNQRTNILHHKELRQSLTCLECGRCNDVCPVFQTIGDEPYNNVFVGPVANITLPYLETIESYRHVAYACTLCGRCEEVCPINLPIRDMIIDSRQSLLADDNIDKEDRHRLNAMRKFISNRKKMNVSNFLKHHLLFKYISSDYRKSHHILPFGKESFNKAYKKLIENEQRNKN